MLPAAPPVVLAVGRWARRSGRSRPAAVGFIAGYLADWAVAGLGHRYPSPGPAGVRAGAVLLVAAGLWQLTPLKHACLRQCQSPLAFLAASAARLTPRPARDRSGRDPARWLLPGTFAASGGGNRRSSTAWATRLQRQNSGNRCDQPLPVLVLPSAGGI